MIRFFKNIFEILVDHSAIDDAICLWWIGQQEVLIGRRKCLLKPEWRV